jgi:hypothetical protein
MVNFHVATAIQIFELVVSQPCVTAQHIVASSLPNYTSHSHHSQPSKRIPITAQQADHTNCKRHKSIPTAKMRLTAELINNSLSYLNPLKERELDLRGAFS